MAEKSRSGRFFELLATAAASGSTIKSAAEACGCSERQAYRIAGSPEFRQRVSEVRSEMTSAAVGELSAAASEAVSTIRQLLGPANEPAIRLSAAKAVLTQLGPVSELAELRARLDALEAGT